MAETFSYRALIQSLEDLFTKISLVVLHKRISSYHCNTSHKEHAVGIKAPLMEIIEITIAETAKLNNTIYESEIVINQDKKFTNQPEEHHDVQYKINRQHINDLSSYFRKRNGSDELHPPLQKKLEDSVWMHMHAACRCARNGDRRNSSLHADIVDCACRELAHYMDEDTYLEFIEEVKDHLASFGPC